MLKNFCKEVWLDRIESYYSSTVATDFYSDQVDMANYDGACFIHMWGTTAGSSGTFIATVVGTDTSTAASTDYETISGSSIAITATTAGTVQKFTRQEVYRPRYRYLKTLINRTGKTNFHGTMVFKYGGRNEAVAATTSGNLKGTPTLVQST